MGRQTRGADRNSPAHGAAPRHFATIYGQGTGFAPADQVCQLAAAGSTPTRADGCRQEPIGCRQEPCVKHNGAKRRRGPSMYEMEGPRLRPAALASRLLGRRALRGARLASLASRLLRCRVLRDATGVRFPTSAPVAWPFRRSRGFPRADPVFSGERFLLPIGWAAQALSARTSRFFCRPQDIWRLSPVHGNFPPRRPQVVHRSCGYWPAHCHWGPVTGPVTVGPAAMGPETVGCRRPEHQVFFAPTASWRRGLSEAPTPGWSHPVREEATDVARPRPASAGRPGAADRGQETQPGQDSRDHGRGRAGERGHRRWRRRQPARVRARDDGTAE
jgi:hypothetical protein